MSILNAEAHHARVGDWYFERYPGLWSSAVVLPFKAAPQEKFTRQQVTNIRMVVCKPTKWPHHSHQSERVLHFEERKVRIDVSNSLNLTKESVNGLGLLGLRFAWKYCPAVPIFTKPRYDGIEVNVWRNNKLIYRFYKATADVLRKQVYLNKLWSTWDEEIKRKEQQEAAARREQQRQQRLAAKRKADAESAAFWGKFWFFAFLIGAGWVWFKYRGPILAFYYHNFTKHPAEDLVNSTIRTGKKLDGQRLADELDKAAKASNPIEAQVRAEQAKDIAAKARKKTAEIKAQEELADAMIDVERAKRAEKRAREAWEKARKNKE